MKDLMADGDGIFKPIGQTPKQSIEFNDNFTILEIRVQRKTSMQPTRFMHKTLMKHGCMNNPNPLSHFWNMSICQMLPHH
jgi:hypothetical protein